MSPATFQAPWHRQVMPSLLLLLASCKPFPCAEGELLLNDGSCSGSQDSGDTADTTLPIDWVLLEGDCSAVELSADPIVERSNIFLYQEQPGVSPFAEIVDLDKRGDLLLGVGQGGLLPYDVSDPDNPEFLGFYPEQMGRYYKVEFVSETRIVVSHRDRGVELVSMDDPSAPRTLSILDGKGCEGLLVHEGLVYVTQRGQGIVVLDPSSDPLSAVTEVGGLPSPWARSKPMDGVAYVADAALGLVPVDLSTPSSPKLGEPVPVSDGGALHVVAADGFVYMSLGSAGVGIFETSDPMAPTLVAQVPTGGSATMAWADDGLLWVGDNKGVAVFDVSDPTEPLNQARELTEQFALAMYSEGDRGYVGDWNYMRILDLDRSVQAPHLEMPGDSFILPEDGGDKLLSIRNMGNAPLVLRGAASAVEGLQVYASSEVLESGEEGWIKLSYAGGAGMEGSVCVSSNDPDEATIDFAVEAGVDDPFIGQPAPDFVLQDLDGKSYKLSDQLGHPVVLAYFATW
jgi:hypothetical protein